MKRYKSKTRREVKGTAPWRQWFSKNERLPEDFVEKFEGIERRNKAAPQKDSLISKLKKLKLKKWEEKQKKNLERRKRKQQDESNTEDKNKVEGVVQKWLQGCH